MFLVDMALRAVLLAGLVAALLTLLHRVLGMRRRPPLWEAVGRWRKAAVPILAISLLGGVVCGVKQAVAAQSSGSVKVGFNYPNASKGLSPNGATFNVNEILSDEVLEEAIELGDLSGLTPEDLKECLEVTSVGAGDRELSAETLYVSTEYNVTYKPSLKTMQYGRRAILEPLAEAYYSYFLENYGRKTDVLEIDFSGLEDLDYLDACTWLEARVSDIITYMSLCSSESSTFLSDVTGKSFSDVRERAENFRDVSLERFQSYVLEYGLSKDSGRYISRLSQENRLTQVDYLKNMAGYGVRLDAIDLYDRDVTTPVLVPTRDGEGEFYQSRTKTEADVFADEADGKLATASERQLEMETGSYHIRMLSASAGGEAETGQAEGMMEVLAAELTDISALARETVEDYDEQMANGYVSFSYGEEAGKWLGYARKAAAYACLLFLIASAAAMAGERKPEGRGGA